MPAQHTSTRSCPCAARARAKPASTEASSDTSTLQAIPPIAAATARPRSSLRSNSATFGALGGRAPARWPRRGPTPPPVTIAATDESIFMKRSFSTVRCGIGQPVSITGSSKRALAAAAESQASAGRRFRVEGQSPVRKPPVMVLQQTRSMKTGLSAWHFELKQERRVPAIFGTLRCILPGPRAAAGRVPVAIVASAGAAGDI